MASTPYHYEPLTSESSFRLFCLKKAQPDLAGLFDMINIHLFDASLENPPKFEAISYAWNHQGLDSTILCNDQPLHVASNVVSILRALQHRDSPGMLWVDSICIDQSSTREKNLQVPEMCSIYRQAEKVWIWLGEGSYETDVTFNFLAEVAAIIQRSDSLGERCRWLNKPLELFPGKEIQSPKIVSDKRSLSQPGFAKAVVSTMQQILASLLIFFTDLGFIAHGRFRSWYLRETRYFFVDRCLSPGHGLLEHSSSSRSLKMG